MNHNPPNCLVCWYAFPATVDFHTHLAGFQVLISNPASPYNKRPMERRMRRETWIKWRRDWDVTEENRSWEWLSLSLKKELITQKWKCTSFLTLMSFRNSVIFVSPCNTKRRNVETALFSHINWPCLTKTYHKSTFKCLNLGLFLTISYTVASEDWQYSA